MERTERSYKMEISKLKKSLEIREQRIKMLEDELERFYKMISTNGEHQNSTNEAYVKFEVKVLNIDPIDFDIDAPWHEIY